MKCDEETAEGGCHEVMLERIRYFTGRHMTARDFRDADSYHRSFRHLHNRILHGWGIACGLDVVLHPNPECRRDRVVVRCGLAIDCCGREILVRKDVVAPRIPWADLPKPPEEQPKQDANAKESATPRDVLLLCLRYTETCTEKVPVLYSPQACSSPDMEYGRIREGYELGWRWVKTEDLDKYGWDTPEACAPSEDEKEGEWTDEDDSGKEGRGRSDDRRQRRERHRHEHRHRHEDRHRHDDRDRNGDRYRQDDPHDQENGGDDCADERKPPRPPREPRPCPDEPGRPACCLDFACPPHHCVPLAVIRARAPEEMDALEDIDISGRRSIAHAREHLTHICWMNWEHGGVVRARDLRSLRVRFDRPLLDAEHPERPGPRGINERTFVVQYGEQYEERQMEDLDFVEYRRPPYLTADGRTAVYEIRNPLSYRSHILHVTIRCDFLLDCRRNPVDGDHLGGRLPTGNGVAGGTFESWFRVVDDEEYDRVMKVGQASADAAQE